VIDPLSFSAISYKILDVKNNFQLLYIPLVTTFV
jgi:hypothetical protein